jgi:hypothetical protein
MSTQSQTIEDSVRQYSDAWNLDGIENIKTALQSCWTKESTYVDPQNGPVKGYDGLAELIQQSYVNLPGRKLRLISAPDVHHTSGEADTISTCSLLIHSFYTY